MGELNPIGTRSKRETKKVYIEREDVIETDGRDTGIKEIGQKEGETIRNEKGVGAIWGNQGDTGILGKESKRLTAAETRQPTCEELSVAGVGFCFCLTCCPLGGHVRWMLGQRRVPFQILNPAGAFGRGFT